MKGVFNKILNIDLNARTFSEEDIEDSVYENYLGGKGLGSHLLLKRNPAGVDPLAPENNLILAVGPANGFPIWGANRLAGFSKSPLTGIYAESYSGGRAYLPMSEVGYDAFILRGALDKWSYLEIKNNSLIFKDASFLIGKDSFETEKALREIYPSYRSGILTIGPAGENLVKYAYVNNDFGRCLGRTGLGAVLGSKKIKALVFTGDRQKEAADPELIYRFRKDLLQEKIESPVTEAYMRAGTSQIVDITTRVEAFPATYWQEGTVPHVDKINTNALLTQCKVKSISCTFCFIACNRMTTVLSGPYEGLHLDGPEYETINAFGGLNLINDIKAIAYLNDICDRLGFDTITGGNVTAFAIEAYKRGKIDFAVDYGEVERIAELLHLIGYRQGIGDLLAEGVRFAAGELGLEDIAIHVKGLEPPGYDPRYLQGMGLGFAISDRGACHLRTTFYKPELAGLIDPLKNEGKAKMLLEYEDRLAIYDTLILCRFFRDFLYWDELNTIVKATMGLDLKEKDLRDISSRIAHTIREFNLQEGLKPEDDFLPEFFFKNPLGSKKIALDRARFKELVDEYYKLRSF